MTLPGFNPLSLGRIPRLTPYVGLSLKLVCMVAVALAISAIIVALMVRNILFADLIRENETITDAITTSLVHDLRYDYLQGRENTSADVVISKYITYYRMIKRISIYDKQFKNIADSEPAYISRTTHDPDITKALSIAKPSLKITGFDQQNLTIRSIAPILRGSKIYAAVALEISIQDIPNSLAAINYKIGLTFAITILISSFAITIMLARSVLPRVRHLIRVTREIAAGNYKIRVNDSQKDEIGQLAEAFNQMTTDLEKSKQALEVYHSKNLEQKVQELRLAYKELENAQSQLVHNEKMASLGLLVAGIAHEINTPLGAIINISKVIEKRAKQLPELLNDFSQDGYHLTPVTIEFIHQLVNSSISLQNSPTFKEIKAVENFLEQHRVDDWRGVARALLNLNFYDLDKIEKYLECFRSPTLFYFTEAIAVISQGVEITQTSCNKVQEIINALRYYAYLDKGKIQLIQVNESIQTALVLLRNKLKHKVNIVLDLKRNIPPIHCTNDIHQIWTNLLNNAYDAIQEMGNDYTGQIVISSRASNDYVMVTISDNGIGIPADDLDSIFDPFFTTKDIGKGTGLGLSIVSGIVRRHHGTIRVGRLQNPTVFEVLLPLKTEPIIYDQKRSIKSSLLSMTP